MDKDRSADPADQRILIHEMTGEIEALRRKRQDRWRDGGHPEAKRFSQEELTDLACPSYKNLLLGRTNRLPARAVVLAIADYLECTIQERNDLLLAAQYRPEVVELRDDQYRAALERARVLAHMIPLPAYVLTRGWRIADANARMLAGNSIPASYDVSQAHETPFDWLGTPSHPANAGYAFDGTMWRETVRSVVGHFHTVHHHFRRESWYHTQLEQIRRLPLFAAIWNELDVNGREHVDVGHTYQWSHQLQTHFQDGAVTMRVCDADFPQVVVYHPVDDASYVAYREFGCTISENRWEQALTLGGTHGQRSQC